MEILDRYYVEDRNGYIFRVVGDYHTTDFIAGYLRYYPTQYGDRNYNNKKYGRNDFVYNTFSLVQNPQDYIDFSDFHGGCVIGVKKNHIKNIFSPVDSLKNLLGDTAIKSFGIPYQTLIYLTRRIYSEVLDEGDIGITGSFLPGLHNEKSDLDFVVYGRSQVIKLRNWLNAEKILDPYTGALGGEIYLRRMKYLPDVDLNTLIKQEARKLQGKLNNTHINFQPLRNEEERRRYSKTVYRPIGKISVIASVTDDTESVFSPAIYIVKCLKVLTSDSSLGRLIVNDIKWFVSFLGLYSNTFVQGENVYVRGTLVKVFHEGEEFYGVLLDPWGYEEQHLAKLI